MSQASWANFAEGPKELCLPDAEESVCLDVRWGRLDCIFTPAYWAHQYWLSGGTISPQRFNLGSNLVEEVAACLLGGYGIPAEVGLAAFTRLRAAGILENREANANEICELLQRPLHVKGRQIRYRFAAQKAKYLALALKRLADESPPKDDPSARKWLMGFEGVGPKTASWIVRNWRGSDLVAIIDVHIFRAGVMAGVFAPTSRISRDYVSLENQFLRFAEGIGISPSALDAFIWREMRKMGQFAVREFHAHLGVDENLMPFSKDPKKESRLG